jgi:hypothetical protein
MADYFGGRIVLNPLKKLKIILICFVWLKTINLAVSTTWEVAQKENRAQAPHPRQQH